ncbi:MupA/Atu3671 family FMN-dependent luciferase-like monooxygenase [Sorangium sp. So ce136]|uniref:MupA/Atu3671 family FMN-dependent luciferase-like monooxygenase n=1 Tax=Sorangium sp. So ce136 TaxID=3133284 RepID=UPI003F001C3A
MRSIMARMFRTGVDDIDPRAPFLEMGADSLALTEAVRIIQTTYGLKLSIRQFFEETTTIAALARYIDEKLPEGWSAPGKAASPGAEPPPWRPQEPVAQAPAPVAPAHAPVAQAQAPVVLPVAAPVLAPAAALAPALPVGALQVPRGELTALLGQQLQVVSQLVSRQLALLSGRPVAPSAEAQAPALGATTPAYAAEPPRPALRIEGSTNGHSHGVATNGAAAHGATENGAAASGAAPAAVVTSRGLGARQQQHLEALVERYNRRTRRSKELTQQHRAHLADSRATVGFRFSTKEMLYPIVGERSSGARIWDVDGNEYVDMTMGFGVHLFGNRPAFVSEALRQELESGVDLGPRSPAAGEVAELICQLTGHERVAFCNSGTEAIMTAIRLVRARTGRSRIALFSGSYHGHSDGTLAERDTSMGPLDSSPVAPGIPRGVASDVVVLEYGAPESLELLRAHGKELAAVLVEPVQSRHLELQPAEFLREVRQITRETGTALFFDEMISGFRVHPAGAQGLFGVQADIATYGKIVGGGMPIGVVAGRAEYLNGIDGGPWRYGDRSYPKEDMTFFGGTFCQHPLAMVAARAVLRRLRDEGPALQQRVSKMVSEFARDANQLFVEHGAPIRIEHFGSQFRFGYSGNMDLLFYHLLERGVYIWEWRNCFLSTAHTAEDMSLVLDALRSSLEELRSGGFLDSAGPVPVDSPLRAKTSPAALKSGSAAAAATLPAPPAAAAPAAAAPAAATAPAAILEPAARRIPQFVERRRGSAAEAGEGAIVAARTARPLELSLSFFGKYDAAFRRDKYDLLFESCRWADDRGFSAAWLPERHFHSFGGLSPNPSLLAAALARTTRNLRLRAGSVVLPLHNPIRVAEEWAVVDNLSGGRVGVAFASGWHPDDFVLAPGNYGSQREITFRDAELVQKLWRGEPVRLPGGAGNPVEIHIHPRPMQAELPLWLTIVNNPETYVKAGQLGVGVLTNLMGQTHEDLARNIRLYRKALADNGWAPERGHVTVLVHTFVDATDAAAREAARRPFNEYLQSSIGLFRNLVKSEQLDIDFDNLTADDRDYLCDKAFSRYLDTSLLVGSPASCEAVVRKLEALGVDEIAAFVDFGVPGQKVMDSLPLLDEVRQRCQRPEPAPRAGGAAIEIGGAVAEIGQARAGQRPLLASQQQMWVLSQISPEGAISYTDLVAIELRGPLDQPALRACLDALVRRHEALRSWISDDGLSQRVADEVALEVPVVALPDDEAARAWLRAHSGAPIDLHRAPALQAHLLALGERRHVLVLRAHHVFIDGWSLGNLVGELGQLYTARRAGRPAELPPAPQFGDFARWQEALQRSERWAEDEAYWLSRLSGPLPTPELPTDRPRPAVMSFRGERQTRRLDARLVRLVGDVSRKHGCTPFMVFFAAYALLLRRLCQQRDLLVGVAVGGRPSELGEGLVGSMSQLLPIRLEQPRDGSFADLLRLVRGTLLEAFEHEAYPYARLVQKLGAGQDLSRAPLVSAVFNYDRPLEIPGFAELEARALPRDIGFARYDLYLNVMTIGGEVELECDYSTDLFEPASIGRTLAAYARLLEQICEDPQGRLPDYAVVTGEDEERLLVAWNATVDDDPAWLPVHRQFEARAQETPDAIAVAVDADLAQGSSVPAQALTYAELDRRASRLAAELRAKGAGPESRVAILAPRSPELIVGLLGILKAGAAFLPLDPAYPASRLTWMLEDAGARLLVTVRSHAGALPAATAERVLVDEVCADAASGAPAAEPGAAVQPGNLAYLMYTSGSTGRPKGVMIPHAGLTDYLRWCREVYPVTDGDGTPLHGSIAFDATLTSIFPALCAGRAVFVVPDEHEIEGLVRALRGGRRFGFVKLTPSHLGMLAELSGGANLLECTGALILGGEALTEAPLAPWKQRAPRLRILNEYGPTEAVVGCAIHEGWDVLPLSGGASIGRPAANTQLYVLDEQMRLLPPGVIGELYIGGVCLARGYNRAPALTAQRFVPNPFAGRTPGAAPGSRLYRTGDRARFLPDGTLEFLGRRDDQVKIRGFRVELGEITAVLAQHPRVLGAVAVVRGDHLVAYVGSDAAGTADEAPLRSALRERLRESLPAHMVPADLVVLASLPLTVNGKVDAPRLPEPTRENPEAAEADRAPRSEIEARIAAVWCELLGLDRVGIHQNFFDLGGHSHLVVRAHRRLVEETGRDVPVVEMFRHPTVATLAALFGDDRAERARAPEASEDREARANARRLALQGQRQRAQKGRS